MSGRSYYGSIGITNDDAPGTSPPGPGTGPVPPAGGSGGDGQRRPLLADAAGPPGRTADLTITSLAAEVRDAAARLASRAWSSLTFGWVGPLLEAGNEAGRLDVEDLAGHPLPADCETEAAYGRFLEEWNRELGGDADGEAPEDTGGGAGGGGGEVRRQPSLIHALARSFGPDFLSAGLLKLVHDANLFVGPQVLNRLINFLRNPGAGLSSGLALTFVGELCFVGLKRPSDGLV